MTKTKGNIIVENIKIGDIHYEFNYNVGVKCKVITKPIRNRKGEWKWKSKNLNTGVIIDYIVVEGMEHYSSNLYDYQAYLIDHWV